MSDEQKRLIIFGSLGLALIIVIALIAWWFLRPQPTVVNNQPAVATSTAGGGVYEPPVVLPATAERIKEDKSYPLGLRQLAMSFAERYGSYSSDEPTKNLVDLQSFMTRSLANRIQADVASTTAFVGFSTKALSLQLVNSNATNATVLVKTQRTQTIGSGQEAKTFLADLELTAVMLNNEWKIDGVAWK